MPQSHCAESTSEWGRIDNSSLFGRSFLVIPGHSSNDNDNDNQFEQCFSRPCSFGRSVWTFWTCSKIMCAQQCPARILFIRVYVHWKRVVIFFVAQLMCYILVILTVFVVVLTVYCVIRTDSETGADQKTVQTNAPVPLSRTYSRTSTNEPFELVRRFIRGHSSPFPYIRVVFFSCMYGRQVSTKVLNMFKTFV